MSKFIEQDTIVALATPPGKSAIAVIRLSGKDSIMSTNKIFRGCNLNTKQTHTVHFGNIVNKQGEVVDEVLVSIFKSPTSFTRENSVEISCHGSQYIVQQIITTLIQQGTRLAQPGEFTKRAYINGRFDLAQAEAVADIINAENELAHKAAIQQMKGGFSSQIQSCRSKLIDIASLMELELDFAEEDVIFADREDLNHLIINLLQHIDKLLDSFAVGNVVKNGIPTTIIGKPNAGKSTLLNSLIKEDRAITSPTPGTTRDTLEESMYIRGIRFRFIDTAGLRTNPDNEIEAIGIKKAKEQIEKADIVIYMFDLANETITSIDTAIKDNEYIKAHIIYVGNKIDMANLEVLESAQERNFILISALNQQNLDDLENSLLEYVEKFDTNQNIIVNARHHESLYRSKTSLEAIIEGIDKRISSDLLMQEVRMALYHLGTITGEISSEDLLSNIFSRFCIGK
jgi:tRNA modification GTPase